jgi:copper chaperone CopZ
MKKTYKIEVDCANCANKMEDAIKKIDGIESASINFMMMKLIIEFKDNINEKNIMKIVEKTCRKIDSDFEIEL